MTAEFFSELALRGPPEERFAQVRALSTAARDRSLSLVRKGATEARWKALQNHELLRALKFVENGYYDGLARVLRAFIDRIRSRTRG